MTAVTGRRQQLSIVGVHRETDGYPSVKHLLRGLRAHPAMDLRECSHPLPAWPRKGVSARLCALLQGLTCHLRALCDLRRMAPDAVIYVPYPALGLLFLWSLLPKRPHQRIVADAFISLHDTVVTDRKLLRPASMAARLLYFCERRALLAADAVVVDSEENTRFIAQSLRLPAARIHAIGLCIDEDAYAAREVADPAPAAELALAARHATPPLRVLFTGTFIPLHGIPVILEAMTQLQTREDLEFVLIGDGQEAPLVERFMMRTGAPLRWARHWHNAQQLASEVARAEICLGIFSPGPKADRVGPLKLHAYACMGKAIITAETSWTRRVRADCVATPFITVPPGDATALATAIAALADDETLRQRLAEASREWYAARLGNGRTLEKLRAVLWPQ